MPLPRRAPAALPTRAAAATLLLGLAGAAQAIVTTTAPGNWIATDFSRFAGVARLLVDGTVGCSGSLLQGGAYVLTAAHCVTDTQGVLQASRVALSFKGGAVTASVGSADQIHVFDAWDGRVGQNNDLALLRLDRAVTSIDGYRPYTADPMGQTIVLTGYGLSGTGGSGWTSGTFGTLRYGYNRYDGLYAGTGSDYAFDFDRGSAANSLFGDTGMSSAEASIAPGDSGGASFILRSGLPYLAGVHSFGYRDTLHDIDRRLDGSFGEAAGDTVLFRPATLGWLYAVTGVPEPAAWALWAAGLLALAGRLRTRRPR